MTMGIPDPQAFKQVIDCIGYSLMGLVGVFGAWQRMKGVSNTGPALDVPNRLKLPKLSPIQRLEHVEQELVSLKTRQEEMYSEMVEHQKSMLQQEAAVFNLLIQQRSAIDKILAKMGGL